MAIVFREKIGRMTIKQNGKKYKIDIWNGNSLAVFTCDYKNEKGEDMRSLYSFFADEQHCKNMMRDFGSLFGDEVVKVEINIAYRDAEKVARILAKAGHKVTIYHNEIKK